MDYFFSLDFFGSSPGFSVENRSKYSSVFGVLMSLTCISISFIIGKRSIENFIYKSGADISASETMLNSTVEIPVRNMKVAYGISEVYPDLTPEGVLKLKEKAIPFDNLGNEFQRPLLINADRDPHELKLNQDENQLEKCKPELFDKPKLNNLTLFWAFCPPSKFMNKTVYKDENQVFKYQGIMFNQNFLKLFENSSIMASVTFLKRLVFPDNYTHPYQELWDTSFIPLDKGKTTVYSLKFQKHVISTSLDNLIVSENSYSYFELHSIEKIVEVDISSGLGKSLEFISQEDGLMFPRLILIYDIHSYQINIDIKYHGINDLISDLGGTFGIVSFFIQIISSYFSDIMLQTFIINNSFDFHSFEKENDNSANSISAVSKGQAKCLKTPQNENNVQSCLSSTLRNYSIENREILSKRKLQKKNVKMGSWDVFLNMFISKSNLNGKHEIIRKALDLTSSIISFPNLLRCILNFYVMKRLMLGSYSKYAIHPSLNIDSPESINYLDLMEKDVSFDTWQSLEIPRIEENKVLTEEITQRIFEIATISNS